MPEDTETDVNFFDEQDASDQLDTSTEVNGEQAQQDSPPEQSEKKAEPLAAESDALLDALNNFADEPESSENETSEVSESSTETAETNTEGVEDVEDEEPRIPKSRLDKEIAKRRALQTEAEAMKLLRKNYADAGLNDETMRAWNELGILMKTNPGAAAMQIAELAKMVGLRVEHDIPADLKPHVDSGALDREAALSIAEQRRTSVPAPKANIPDFTKPAYSMEQATQDMQDVAQSYIESYPDIFNKPDVIEEVKKSMAAKVKEIKELTGHDPSPDKLGHMSDNILKSIVSKHKQPVRRPVEKPLRPTSTGSVRKQIKSFDDIAEIDW